MNKIGILLILILSVNQSSRAALPPNSLELMAQSLNKDMVSGEAVDKEELLSKFTRYNYSTIWMKQNNALLGFIGNEHYQRLYMRFLSIIKHSDDPAVYSVSGKSRVKSNICEFNGTIKLLHVRRNGNKEESDGRYVLVAEYHFEENATQKGSGTFEGILVSYFTVNNNKAVYDDWWESADGYRNNQCAGIWTSYSTGASKICNWGEYRIPFSEALDKGSGEFFPSEKYLPFGWRSYAKAIEGDAAAQAEEQREWWR